MALAGAAAMATMSVPTTAGTSSPRFHIPSLAVEAANGPTLTVFPSTNLVDGQFARVRFTGLPPAIGVAFRQCMSTATAATADQTCTANNTQATGVTNASGAGLVYLPIYATGDPALKSKGGHTMKCDFSDPCLIAAVFKDLSQVQHALVAKISFAPSPDSCPPPQAGGVLGSGSASAYRAIYAWQSVVCLPPINLSVGYALGNSVDGSGNILKGLADFGVAGPVPPLAGTDPNEYAPLTLSAVVLAYRIYDRRGPQVTSLVLTPSLIAQIYRGQIQNWNASPPIQALNPGIEFPSRTSILARAEHSSQSYVFTSWLSAAAPADWVDGSGKPLGASAIFPMPASGVYGVTGSDNLANAVIDPSTDFFGQGNIGFMDSSTAAFYGLPMVQIKEASGAIVAATPDSIEKAISLDTLNPNGTVALNYAPTDPTAYPMAMPTYLLAPTRTISWDRGVTLASFLRYAVQASLGQSNLPAGYAPLPDNLRTQSMKVAGDVPATAPPTPTPSPSPLPSPLPLPSLPPYVPAFLPPPPTATPAPIAVPCPGAASSARISSPASAARTSSTTASAGRTALPSYCLPLATLSESQGAMLAFLVQAGDTTAARYVVPSIGLLGMLALLAGGVVELLVRRRRLGSLQP